MKKLFSNVKFISFVIVLSLVLGSVVGYFLGQLPQNVKGGLSYGFVAFSILPITICLFGVKESGAVFSAVAKYLDSRKRANLIKSIDVVAKRIISLAFSIVFLQVVAAFCLLYFSNTYEYVILGILFGGIISSLFYGLYVLFSVRKLIEMSDSVLDRSIHRERHEKYVNSFKD